jgi:hypothetical protein
MFVVRTSQELSAHEKEKQVKEMPSVLEFLGYIYFFPSFLAGPHIYFADYKRYARTHAQRKNIHNRPRPVLLARERSTDRSTCWSTDSLRARSIPRARRRRR